MSQSTVERVQEPASAGEARKFFPDADEAAQALSEHPGETFADFNDVHGLTVGTISTDAEEPITFYRSRWPDQPEEHGRVHASVALSEGTDYDFSPIHGGNGSVETDKTTIDGPHDTYIGTRVMHNNPYAVFAAGDIEFAQEIEGRHGRVLVIGDRACGAFAYGQALRDIGQRGPASLQTSKALLLVTELEAREADWHPDSGEVDERFDQVSGELQDTFERGALVPLIIARLGLSGSQWAIKGDAIATRAKTMIFGMGMDRRTDLRDRLIDRMNFQIANGDLGDADKRLTLLAKAAESHGNDRAYIQEAVDNILKNQLGIPLAY
jgi:hypothetical protein